MSTQFDETYANFLRKILAQGTTKTDRTGTGTISVLGCEMEFDLSNGSIPLLTTKKMHMKSIVHELLWFLRGDTNNHSLRNVGVTIWDEWAKEDGSLGKIYGHQWRHWDSFKRVHSDNVEKRQKYEADGYRLVIADTDFDEVVYYKAIDQIAEAIRMIREEPDSRRIIVSAWNVGDLDEMQLAPCHAFFQFYVADGTLSLKLTQRSADAFLGVPFNIAQYSILLRMVAHVTNLKPGKFIWSGGDCHIYSNHMEQVKLQLSRQPFASPVLDIVHQRDNINDFVYDDVVVSGYQSHPSIKAIVAI